ncbi:MAG: hemerythrin domain-containing protein [Rubrivivax sp.]|nr:hemerythrin domain-containing protein [Rubrivivax sp.]
MSAPAPTPTVGAAAAATARASRPARSPIATPDDFQALDQTHREVQATLARFGELLDHVDDNGPDESARRTAAEIRAFFEGHARQHHADEERLVFPALLAGGDAELVQHVMRLQQDHGWLEEDWLELAPQIEAIERGYNWYDLASLRHALPVFAALYAEHIVLEETVVYPAAKRHQQALAAGMAARTRP